MKVVYFAPQGFDYLSNQLTEGFHLLSKEGELEFLCTNKVVHHGAKIDDLITVSEQEAIANADSADLILFSSGGDYTFATGEKSSVFNDKKYRNKRIFIDGHDSDAFLCDMNEHLVYFKRELRYPTARMMMNGNIRSILFGVYQFLIDNMPTPGWDERDIDVSFIAFGGSNPARKMIHDAFHHRNRDLKMNLCIQVAGDKQPVEIDEYRNLMRRSKVGISIPGAGIDTLRFWETMAHGAVLCSTDVGAGMVCRNVPEPHRHAVYFDNATTMVELAKLVVSDKQRWQQMRRATDSLLECHTTKMRAREILAIAKEMA